MSERKVKVLERRVERVLRGLRVLGSTQGRFEAAMVERLRGFLTATVEREVGRLRVEGGVAGEFRVSDLSSGPRIQPYGDVIDVGEAEE